MYRSNAYLRLPVLIPRIIDIVHDHPIRIAMGEYLTSGQCCKGGATTVAVGDQHEKAVNNFHEESKKNEGVADNN